MTSDDTPGTLPWCKTCPGEGRCYRERSSTLANAYALGCRSPEATAANAQKARERRARVRSGGSSGSPTDAWADTDDIPEREPTGEVCECGSPFYWEPGRGAQTCDNGHWGNAPGTETRVARATDVAVRERTDPVAEAAAKARLRALREKAVNWVNDWIDTIGDDECYDRVQWQREARDLAALLRGWIPEIQSAESEETLSAIKRYIWSEILDSEEGKAIRSEYEQAQNRAETQYYARQRAKELEERQQKLAEQAEYERQEAEREEREAARAREIEARQPKAITAGRTTVVPTSKYAGFIYLASEIQKAQQQKERAIAENGKCEFGHQWVSAVASRIYGVPERDWRGNMVWFALPGTPLYYACSKHYDTAESRLNAEGYADVCNWELPLSSPITRE